MTEQLLNISPPLSDSAIAELTFDKNPYPMVVFNSQQMAITKVNASFCTLFEAQLPEIVNEPVELLFENEESLTNALKTFYGKNAPYTFTANLKPINANTPFPGEISMQNLDQDHCFFIIQEASSPNQDAIEKEALEQQVFQAQKMEAIGRLAGGIAHDFNNILAAMSGYTEFLLEDLENGSDQYDYAKNIDTSITQAKDIVTKILAFSRKKESSQTLFYLKDVIDETSSMLCATLPSSLKLDRNINPLDYPFYGDRSLIAQMLMNICVNAKDAIESKRGTISLHLKPLENYDRFSKDMNDRLDIHIDTQDGDRTILQLGSIHKDKTYAQLIISDTGTGMQRETLEHIFEPFFTTKEVNKGTGLGMSMVHGTILKCDGVLMIDTMPNVGSRFDILLPLDKDRKLDKGSHNLKDQDIDGEGLKIVVIDDQTEVLKMLHQMLTRKNFKVIDFDNPEEALEYIQTYKNEISCIISDFSMPNMNGAEVAEKTYDIHEDIPFIIVSGYNDGKLEEQLENHPNILGNLKKPVKSSDLFTNLKQILWFDE